MIPVGGELRSLEAAWAAGIEFLRPTVARWLTAATDATPDGFVFERPTLLSIAGPAASGKTTFLNELRNLWAVPAVLNTTTRDPRPGERDGWEYRFFTRDRFDAAFGSGEFAVTSYKSDRGWYGVTWDDAVRSGRSARPMVTLIESPLTALRLRDELERSGVELDLVQIYLLPASPTIETTRKYLVDRPGSSASDLALLRESGTRQLEEFLSLGLVSARWPVNVLQGFAPIAAAQLVGRQFSAQAQHCASVVVRDSHGRVLLIERDKMSGIRYPGYWSLPAGGIEPDERPVDAARRELSEELGLDELDVRFLFSYETDFGVIESVHAVTLANESVRLGEGRQYAWFEMSGLPKPIARHHQIVLNRVEGIL